MIVAVLSTKCWGDLVCSHRQPEQRGPVKEGFTGISTNRHSDESWPHGNKGQFYLLDCVSIALRNEEFRAGQYVHLCRTR